VDVIFLQYFDGVTFLLVVKFACCFALCEKHFSKASLAQHTDESKTMSVTELYLLVHVPWTCNCAA